MSGRGYIYWDAEFFVGYPYLGGYVLSSKLGPGFSFDEAIGVYVLPTHGRTAIVQKPYVGDTRPLELAAMEFRLQRTAVHEEDWFKVRRVKAKGAAAYFVPYLWTEEVLEVVSGSQYILGRSVAWGIAPGVSSGTHPARFFLDDVEDGAAASISGQTLTAAATGTLAVRYMPAFKVIVGPISNNVADLNAMEFQATLTEILEVPS